MFLKEKMIQLREIEGTRYERMQRIYARLAGFLFLVVIILAFGGGFLDSYVAGSGAFAEKASRIAASEHLYRVGLSSTLLAFLFGVVLFSSLHVILKPVNNFLAQLALIFCLLDSVLGCVVQMCGFVRLHLYTSALTAGTGTVTAQALMDLLRSIVDATENIGGIAFGIGLLLFFYLFFESAYISKAISALGVFASVVWVALYLARLVFPEQRTLFQCICFPPMGLAQIIIGFRLMLFPLRATLYVEANNRA